MTSLRPAVPAASDELSINLLLSDSDIDGINIGLNHNHLVSVSLSGNVDENTLTKISNALRTTTSLKELRLLHNNFTRGSEMEIISDIYSNAESSLQVLNLSYNCIQGYGEVKSLCDMLRVNQGLIRLDLYGNRIDDEGSMIIAEALGVNQTLQELQLGLNRIGDEGCKALTDSLLVNKTITKFYFENNRIGERSMHYWGEVLKHNKTLQVLNLSSNRITEVTELAMALKDNKTLHTLHLMDNSLTHQAEMELCEALNENDYIQYLQMPVFTMDPFKFITKTQKNRQRRLDNFLNAINGDSKAPWNRSRVMIVGQARAGKSSTVRSLLGQAFNPEWDSTVGGNISESTATASGWKQLDDQHGFSFQFAARALFHDGDAENTAASINTGMAGQEKRTKATEEKPKDETNRALTQTSQKGGGGLLPEAKLIKPLDLKMKKEGHGFEEIFSLDPLWEANRSANSLNLTIWDFGGQEVFYSMHHLFLTNTGIYFLIFDIRDLVDSEKKKTAHEYLLFWLRSIHLHAPSSPLFLVGTFSEEVQQSATIREINSYLLELAERSLEQIIPNIDDKLTFFPIDNKAKSGVQQLRSVVEAVIWKDETVRQEVSIRWMRILDDVNKFKASNQVPYLSLSDYKSLAHKVGVYDSEEIEFSLKLFHERGVLIHLTSTEVLKNTIVVQPQWLLTSFGNIIRDRTVHSYDIEEFRKVGLEEDLRMTFETAVTTRDFLEYVWHNDNIDFLIDIMKRTMLLSEWPFKNTEEDNNDESCYLIPSLLHNSNEEKKDMDGLKCIFDFSDNYLPNGVFQRLVCLCLQLSLKSQDGHKTGKRPRLFQNFAAINFEAGLALCLRENKSMHSITVFVLDHMHASRIFNIVQSMLLKLNYDAMGTGLVWETWFENTANDELISLDQARKKKLYPWFSEDVQKERVVENIDLGSFLDSF